MGGERGRANWNSSYSSYNLKKSRAQVQLERVGLVQCGPIIFSPNSTLRVKIRPNNYARSIFTNGDRFGRAHSPLCQSTGN